MDCIDCHNRVGHEVPTIDNAIDAQISAGSVSTDLPDIKRQARGDPVGRLCVRPPTADSRDRRAERLLRDALPARREGSSAEIDTAISSLQTTYRLLATPEMKADAATYPNNIGHQQSPGCFRCHDGAHYKIVDGKVSTETIPSQCSTCHTFPQIGENESGVLIGQRPTTHDDRLWVFDHKLSVTSADPTNQACARLPYAHLLRELPQDDRRQRLARLDGHRARDGRARHRRAGVRLLPRARLLRPMPRRSGSARRSGRNRPGAQRHRRGPAAAGLPEPRPAMSIAVARGRAARRSGSRSMRLRSWLEFPSPPFAAGVTPARCAPSRRRAVTVALRARPCSISPARRGGVSWSAATAKHRSGSFARTGASCAGLTKS